MEKPKKNKPYMMYLKQSLAAVKPQYHAYRDGKSFDSTLEEVAVALAVICDHVSDKDSTWRH